MEPDYICKKAQFDGLVKLFESFPRKGVHNELFDFSHLLTADTNDISHLQSLERIIPLLITYLNELVSQLWSIRNENKRIVNALTLRSHLDRCQLLLTESALQISKLLSKTVGSYRSVSLRQQRNIRYLETKLAVCQTEAIPLLIEHLNHVIIETITSSYQSEFERLFAHNSDTFLDNWTLFPTGWLCSSSSANNTISSESFLFESLIGKNAMTMPVSAMTSKYLSSSSTKVLIFSDIIVDILSTQLLCLLSTIINLHMPIDEAGLYKLYRLILKLQETATTTKQQLGIPVSEQLIHPSIWQLCQHIIDSLNESIFDATDRTVLPMPPMPAHLEKYPRLRKYWEIIADANAWRNLTRKFGKSSKRLQWKKLLSWKKRHAGTVFVVLTIPLNPM